MSSGSNVGLIVLTTAYLVLMPFLGTAQQRLPMTDAEAAAMVGEVSACWNVSGLSAEARAVTITVGFDLSPDGVPVTASIALLAREGGDDAAAARAFDVARRAIIRCGTFGYKLPPEKYEEWASIQMIFAPQSMRLK